MDGLTRARTAAGDARAPLPPRRPRAAARARRAAKPPPTIQIQVHLARARDARGRRDHETREPAAPSDEPALPPLTGPAPAPGTDPAAVYLASLTPGPGRAAMRSTLAGIAKAFGHRLPECPWAALRARHVVALRTRLVSLNKAPATVNKTLSALRQVMRHAQLIGFVTDEEIGKLAHVRNDAGRREPPGRALDDDDLEKLCRTCDDGTNAGARDAAIVALMAGMGLRRAEAAAADVADYDAREGTLRVRGKGNRARLAYPAPGTRAALDAWLTVRGQAPGPLLAPVLKAGTVRRGGITGQTLAARVRLRARRAGILHPRAADKSKRRCSPHDLRRTFITRALDGGLDLAMVQSLAGHVSPTTTARYDRRPEAARAAAARRLDLPFPRA